MYPQVQLFIDGVWRSGSEGKSETVLNPATGLAVLEKFRMLREAISTLRWPPRRPALRFGARPPPMIATFMRKAAKQHPIERADAIAG